MRIIKTELINSTYFKKNSFLRMEKESCIEKNDARFLEAVCDGTGKEVTIEIFAEEIEKSNSILSDVLFLHLKEMKK